MSFETSDTYEQLSAGKVPGAKTGIEIRKSICSICNPHSHCGIDAYVKDGMIVKIEGTKENPHSDGTLCSKGKEPPGRARLPRSHIRLSRFQVAPVRGESRERKALKQFSKTRPI